MAENLNMKRRNPIRTIILSALLCIALFLAELALFHQYENGILEINSEQQDGYVKLVADQIRLQEGNTSEEIIQNILSTLDSSSSRYWTFADDGSIVFVKNREETGLYQSVPTARYFADQGNSDFIKSLRNNRVIHQVITLDDEKYIASGTLFRYNNRNYQLILLTSVNSILENNVFLEARTELYAVLIAALVILFTVIIAETLRYNRLYDEMAGEEKENTRLRNTVTEQNEKETERKSLDPSQNIFPLSYLKRALKEISEKNAFPVSLFLYGYPDQERRNACIEEASRWITSREILFDDPQQRQFVLVSMKTDDRTRQRLKKLQDRYPEAHVVCYENPEEMRKDSVR